MSKEQKDYLLKQQLRAIQQELGEKDGEKAEIELLRERFEKANLPEEAKKEFERELAKLERLPSAAPDFHVTRSYLEFVLDPVPSGRQVGDARDAWERALRAAALRC